MHDTVLQFCAKAVYNSRYDKVPIHVTCINRTRFCLLVYNPNIISKTCEC
jgi:hypothetical protein